MSTEPEDSGPGYTEVDALLARLPQWTPPAGFSARLAAAAARQAERPSRGALSTRAWVLRRVGHRAPMILGSALLASALALIPWVGIATNPLFPWIFSIGSAALGSLMTLRLIRT